MFTGDLVDTRSRTQKRQDKQRTLPTQLDLLSAREVLQFGVNGKPPLPLAEKTRLELVSEDPRTDEEKAHDTQRAAEALNYRLPVDDERDDEILPDEDWIAYVAAVQLGFTTF
jgi:hypothetical protein